MDKIPKSCRPVFFFFAIIVFANVQAAPTVPKDKGCRDYNAMEFIMCLSHCSMTTEECEAYPKKTYPQIKCHTRPGKCNTCEVYYKYGGKEVECNPRKIVQVCPADKPRADCGDPCKATVCRPFKFKGAKCRFDDCGGCRTEYFVDNRWQTCPDGQIAGGNNVHSSHNTICPNGNTPKTCSSYSCEQTSCPNHFSAKCIPDSCNNCKAEYFVFSRNHDAVQVDCSTSECPIDAVAASCPPDLCNYMPCPRHPDAKCVVDRCTQCHVNFILPNGDVIDKDQCFDRPACPVARDTSCNKDVCRASFCPGQMTTWCRMNDCGGCRAEWYNSTSGEIISCPYFDRLFEKSHVHKEHVEHAGSNTVVDVHPNEPGHAQVDHVPVGTTDAYPHEPGHGHVDHVPVNPADVHGHSSSSTTETGLGSLSTQQTLELLIRLIDELKRDLHTRQERQRQQAQKKEHKTVVAEEAPKSHQAITKIETKNKPALAAAAEKDVKPESAVSSAKSDIQTNLGGIPESPVSSVKSDIQTNPGGIPVSDFQNLDLPAIDNVGSTQG